MTLWEENVHEIGIRTTRKRPKLNLRGFVSGKGLLKGLAGAGTVCRFAAIALAKRLVPLDSVVGKREATRTIHLRQN